MFFEERVLFADKSISSSDDVLLSDVLSCDVLSFGILSCDMIRCTSI
jgi:hypothetical protein